MNNPLAIAIDNLLNLFDADGNASGWLEARVKRIAEAQEALAKYQTHVLVSGQDMKKFTLDVALSVAEIPDRTSPDDQPEMMLVTSEELIGIIESWELLIEAAEEKV